MLGFAVLALCLGSCSKDEVSLIDVNSDAKFSKQNEGKLYEGSDPMELIKLASVNYHDKLTGKLAQREEGVWIEIISGGEFRECGDGSAECLPPDRICMIIVCADAQTSGVFVDVDIIPNGEETYVMEHMDVSVDESGFQKSTLYPYYPVSATISYHAHVE